MIFLIWYFRIAIIVMLITLIYGFINFLIPKRRENYLYNFFGSDFIVILKAVIFWIMFSIYTGLIWVISIPYLILKWVFSEPYEGKEGDD